MSDVDPRKYTFDENTEIVDVDLDDEIVMFEGERLTEARAQEVADDVLAEVRRRNLRPGGKSLTGGSAVSPVLQVRVPRELKDSLERESKSRNIGLSKLVRSILEGHVKKG